MKSAWICDYIRTPSAALALARQNARFALATMCIGVGQGIAIGLERL